MGLFGGRLLTCPVQTNTATDLAFLGLRRSVLNLPESLRVTHVARRQDSSTSPSDRAVGKVSGRRVMTERSAAQSM